MRELPQVSGLLLSDAFCLARAGHVVHLKDRRQFSDGLCGLVLSSR
jgi:hypothetical protein